MVGPGELGEAEIRHLGFSELREEDVLRLDIAVEDARPVRRFHGTGDAHPEVQNILEVQHPLADQLVG